MTSMQQIDDDLDYMQDKIGGVKLEQQILKSLTQRGIKAKIIKTRRIKNGGLKNADSSIRIVGENFEINLGDTDNG